MVCGTQEVVVEKTISDRHRCSFQKDYVNQDEKKVYFASIPE